MRYVCKLCGKEYAVRESIYKHLRTKHNWSFEKGDVRELIERVIEK